MTGKNVHADYLAMLEMLGRGDIKELEVACEIVPGFPHGTDMLVQCAWIINAIDCGASDTVHWMIGKDVELNFVDDEGGTPIHACLDRRMADRYDILQGLIEAGADVNCYGVSDWTPLHKAAVQDDRHAMLMLLKAGADRTLRTRIDDYATPEEEARNLGHVASADFLASYRS